MEKIANNTWASLVVVLIAGVLFRLFILNFLPLDHHLRLEELFVSNLLGNPLILPKWIIWICGVVNILLMWLVGNRLFGKRIAFISSLLFAISPWTGYLDSAGAFYTFLLSLLLIGFLSLLNLKGSKLWTVLFVVSITALFYSSILMWIVVPILLLGAIKTKQIGSSKALSSILAVTLIPLLLLALTHLSAFKSEWGLRASIFRSPGLVNTVNQYRGELIGTPYEKFGRLIENRYFYLSEHIALTTLQHFAPSTYFTSDARLLYFSYSPPIYLGFLIPAIIGLSGWLALLRKYGLVALVPLSLMIPSILYHYTPFMNRLVIFAPVIFLTISYGMADLMKHKEKKWRIILFITVALVAVQFLTVLSDIVLREGVRIQILQEIL
jgi:hypothetical protein